MAKQKKKGKGKVKLFLVLLLIIAILLVIIFFGGKGFGFGGSGNGDGDAGTKVENEVNTEDVQESKDSNALAGEEGELGAVVVVTIKGEQVFVGDKEFANASELKAYIEEINTDDREFKLQDENSILATYEWVVDVFEELKIQLVPVAE